MKEKYEITTTTKWDADRIPGPVVHARQMLGERAAFAKEIIARWALVAGESDGEDSAGRSKLRCMTPTESATRACDVADAAFGEFYKRGWVIDMPSLDEMREEIKNRENKNG